MSDSFDAMMLHGRMVADGRMTIDLSNEDEFPVHGPPVMIRLISDSESEEEKVDLDITFDDLESEESEDAPMAPGSVLVVAPEIYEEVAMTGVPFDPSVGPALIRAMLVEFPLERLTREFFTFLCFEEKILHNRRLREHASCFESWNMGGSPVLDGDVDLRFEPDDLPDWVSIGATNMLPTRLQIFDDQMTFWWRTMVAPFLPVVLVERVRENGDGGGLQFVARNRVHFSVIRNALPSFLEEISEGAMEFLRAHGYGSLIHVVRVTAQDHCAILFGPGKFAEHRCQADVQISDHVGPGYSLELLQDYEAGNIGLVLDPDGHHLMRFRRTYDEDRMRYHRVYWEEGERICWDYSGGDNWRGVGPVFVCDCVVCLAGMIIPK